MAIHNEEVSSNSSGFAKTIDEAGLSLVLDNLQRYQYVYPIKSTVREIICNGIDSIAEKQVARKILNGENKPEDFFVEREGALYKDSHFKSDYYNLNWLSEHDYVEMNYIIGKELEKDKVVFTDYGVGIGGERLEGYFKLSYSTKRLSKLPLGKFGIGAKSPLSVVDFYTVESRYNGRKYRFNIYSKNVDSIVPRFNLTTGEENEFVLFAEGTEDEYKVYYESTEDKNGFTVILEAKKFQKKQYIEAVRSQLLYFPNIVLTITNEQGFQEVIDYRASIMYEDDLIILSDNTYYDKPHLLLNKVNYGYVNWEELELENKLGNIGIKVAPEDIEVNPSREAVVWSEKTKEMVLGRFNSVVEIATQMIEKELHQDDFLQWLRTCYNLTSFTRGGNSVVGRLAKIVDLSEVKPSYIPNPKIKFNQKTKLFGDLYIRIVHFSNEEKNNRFRKVVKRKETTTVQDVIFKKIYLMKADGKASNRKDKYLLNEIGRDISLSNPDFAVIYTPLVTREEMVLAGMSEQAISDIMVERNKNGTSAPIIFDLIAKSKGIEYYDDIIVPEDFKGTDEEEEVAPEPEKVTEEEKEEEKRIILTKKERLQQEGKIIVQTPLSPNWTNIPYGTSDNPLKIYDMQKMEMPIKDINNWEAQEIYYGSAEQLHLAAMLSREPDIRNKVWHAMRPTGFYKDKDGKMKEPSYVGWMEKKYYRLNKDNISKWLPKYQQNKAYYCQHFFDTNIILISVAKKDAKYVRDFRPIEQFFIRIRNKVITMSNLLVKWNTARVIREKLVNCAFLFNFDSFNADYTEMYNKLVKYVKENYREVGQYQDNNYFGLNRPTYQGLISHLDNVQIFQDYVRRNPTATAEIAQLAQDLFANRELKDGHAVDPEVMQMLDEILEFSKACGDMLNWIPALTGNQNLSKETVYNLEITRVKVPIPENLEQEIKSYLDGLGVLNFQSSFKPIQEPKYVAGVDLYSKEENNGVVTIYNSKGFVDGLPVVQDDSAKLFIQE